MHNDYSLAPDKLEIKREMSDYQLKSADDYISTSNAKKLGPNFFKVFANELSGCGFKSHCSHLNFRYYNCFEEGVP